ncbi:hypothetical protein F0562_025722 [Nyssa sinensis]|uniref:Uncharacterized protein n=1 Tax=Nyssa sinensis TaxID=561372 RepID=A0A5J5B9A4_9ASTE|nr:hypothetical protein F0562_025722 [Nyssa sinensis]
MQQCYTSLEDLKIRDSCDSLKALSLGFPKLRSLIIFECTNFESLSVPKEIQNLASAASLNISGCPNMVSFPGGRLPAPNLNSILISDCKKLKSLTEGMHLQLPSLKNLSIVECPELESFPKEGLPSSLLHLSIVNCDKLTNRRMEFPDDMLLLPSSLTTLDISLPNLESLNHKALQHLTSLQEMRISDCPRLQSLPEGLPTSLSRLEIWGCLLLKPRCERENGADWSKISRIPYINNNGARKPQLSASFKFLKDHFHPIESPIAAKDMLCFDVVLLRCRGSCTRPVAKITD